jgi:hypothetical protein
MKAPFTGLAACSSLPPKSKMTEQADQDDDWNWYAEQQQQD